MLCLGGDTSRKRRRAVRRLQEGKHDRQLSNARQIVDRPALRGLTHSHPLQEDPTCQSFNTACWYWGARPAGENAADIAAREGLRVATIEGDLVGGECSIGDACRPRPTPSGRSSRGSRSGSRRSPAWSCKRPSNGWGSLFTPRRPPIPSPDPQSGGAQTRPSGRMTCLAGR
jgi:hypothetical protein